MQIYSNELYHYGVIGMKWGVRRYQNPDGSLTARGRKRYGTEEHLNAKREYKSAYKQYSKDLNRAMNNGPIHITKKGRAKNDELWKKADEGLDKAADAYNKYKAARKEAKPVIKEARKLTDEQKAKLVKGLKIGAAVAGTALVAYGAYKIGSKAMARHKLSGKLAAERLAREYGSKTIASEFASKNGDIWGRIDTKAMGDPDSYGSQYIRNLLYRNTGYIGGKHEVYNFDPKTGKYFKFDYNWDKK